MPPWSAATSRGRSAGPHSHSLDLPAAQRGHVADLHRSDVSLLPSVRPQRRLGQARLEIDVLYYDTKGKLLSTKPYGYETTATAWQPTPTIAIDVFRKTTVAAAPVAFRFMPKGKDAHFLIDDVLRRSVRPRLS